jgi:hypothetical protein
VRDILEGEIKNDPRMLSFLVHQYQVLFHWSWNPLRLFRNSPKKCTRFKKRRSRAGCGRRERKAPVDRFQFYIQECYSQRDFPKASAVEPNRGLPFSNSRPTGIQPCRFMETPNDIKPGMRGVDFSYFQKFIGLKLGHPPLQCLHGILWRL